MSGGSMEYLYQKVEDCYFDRNTPLRKAFAVHLKKVAKALHDIEWVDSCDYGKGDEDGAIRECLSEGAEIEITVLEAKEVMGQLKEAIKRAEK